jgi:ketosteroid isomerase-like protein
MSQENVELVYQANDAFNRHDINAFLAFAAPDFEFLPLIARLEGGGPYRSHESVRSWWESLLDIAPDFSAEIENVRDLGDVTVLRVRFRGHGTASGATMEQTAWQVVEWREKKCVRFLVFGSEAEALEAAGLSEEDRAHGDPP